MQVTHHYFSSSEELNRELTAWVALPINLNLEKPLPVLYTHDAQNIFDIWDYKETKTFILPYLDKLFSQGFPPFAIVGIDTWNTNNSYKEKLERFTDFSPWKSQKLLQYLPSWPKDINYKIGGRGNIYSQYLANEIIPFIEQEYNIGGVSQLRAIAGFSMGAMISLYIGTEYNDLFSKFGFLSPALWCFKEEYIQYLSTIKPFKPSDKIYIDIGRKETSDILFSQFNQEYLDGAYKIFDLLKNKASDLLFYIDEYGKHDMPSISRHFIKMIHYFWK